MKAGTSVDDDFNQLKGKASVCNAVPPRIATPPTSCDRGYRDFRYGSQSEIYWDMQSDRLDGTIANAAPLQEGFLKTPQGQGFAFVGPELRNKECFGEAPASR